MEAAQRRQQRESQRRFRELQRQAKEQAKLSAQEQARLEVETYENRLELLLSIHKEQGEVWDWNAICTARPPIAPQRLNQREDEALARLNAYSPNTSNLVSGRADRESARLAAEVDASRQEDESDFQQAEQAYQQAYSDWKNFRDLAKRILAGDSKAYAQALRELSPFAEIAELGSSVQFTVETPKLIKCALKVSGTEAIPSEVKSLTASGKVSIKPMPKARFHEIYQDYICGCVLRAAREVLALLPVETVLITATVDVFDSVRMFPVEQPVLSVALTRIAIEKFRFEQLDASDTVDCFQHRGDFKTSRSSGAFVPIVPLEPSDLFRSAVAGTSVDELLAGVRQLRKEVASQIARMNSKPESLVSEDRQS